MTEIEKKALALVNEVRKGRLEMPLGWIERETSIADETLCRAIEQHEAFKREVSDAVEVHMSWLPKDYAERSTILKRFILPKSVDPLVEAMLECGFGDSSNAADDIRAALASRGLEIREIKR